MRIENPDNYTFVKFEVSSSKGKKYDAILKNKLTGRTKKVSFGAKGMEQYKDSTGLGKYTNANHNDPVRRALYRKRHAGEEKHKFSSGWFAWHYLW